MKFQKLNRNEMRLVTGGVAQPSTCSASCGGGKSVSCSGTDCYAEDGNGCDAVKSNGTADSHSCADQ